MSIEILGSEREMFSLGELALTKTEPSGMVEYVFDPGRKRLRQAVFARLFITHMAFSGLAPCTLYTSSETVDIVTLAATLRSDGIVDVPISGTGLFAVATSNVGAQ